MTNKLWIIGCGDIGRRVVSLYKNQINKQLVNIHALVSSQASKKYCEILGISSVALDLGNKKTLVNLGKQIQDSQLFYFAPPPLAGMEDTRLKNFLSSLIVQPKRIVLISTTGVYGDSNGEWIDESYLIKPQAERAYRRLSAEKTLQEWASTYQREYIILRVPGIYAKDRLPLARLKKGLPVVNQEEAGWTNRIHADDLAMVCKLAMESNISGEIYNVTDGHPSTMTEYFNQVADYANLARPPQISMQQAESTLSKGMVSYLQESRRISNQKMRDELGVELAYPSLMQGLRLETSKK
ncbi:MAG: NAD-dependent epimerase/dehydratase family protein [Cocleimonas sp.]|nr:NAD-dependent epimerase/dehydratase family protein [Cocleimonas sp.]